MTFKQWLSQTLTPQARAVRPSRPRFVPRAEPLEDRTAPAVVTVTSVLDTVNPNDGVLTFREAVVASTSRTGGATGDDTTRFAPALDGGTVTLSAFRSDGVAGLSAFLIRNAKLVIDGETGLTNGVATARNPAIRPFRLFYVDPGTQVSVADLTLRGVTVRGFYARGGAGGAGPDTGALGSGSGASGGGAAGLGGAISNRGNLTLVNSTLTGNTAEGGAGGYTTGFTAFGFGNGGAGGGGMCGAGFSPSGNGGGDGGGPNAGAKAEGFGAATTAATAGSAAAASSTSATRSTGTRRQPPPPRPSPTPSSPSWGPRPSASGRLVSPARPT